MAELFLEEIYQYAKTISKLRHIVDIIREHDEHNAVIELNNCIQDIGNLARACVESQYEDAKELCNQILLINSIQSDLILLGDVIESTIIPIMEKWVQNLGEIFQQVDEEYLLESTACGFLTVRNLRTNKYLHSNNNPMEEARKMVQCFYEPERSKYSVWGCGLGYHVYALYLISNGSVPIKIYDTDHRIVEYAKRYGVLEWIPKENLEVIVCDSVMPFLDDINNDETGVIFHLPSLGQIKDEVQRNGLYGIYTSLNTTCRLDKDVRINFGRNVSAGLPDICKIDNTNIKEEIVVVAAGPSLDDNMELLHSWQKDKTIVAVGTVFKKLVLNDIRPDFVIIIDPQKRTLKQLEGVENEDIPLILSMTAYWEFAVKYRGPKYAVCTGKNKKFIRNYAEKHSLITWPNCGTVASAALEFAIHFKAKKIYLVGLDLAYPTDMSHASDTMDYQKKDTEHMPLVEGVRGSKVRSDCVFISYKKSIEDRISETKDIIYYNMSLRGVRIKGTIECDAETKEYKYNNILNKVQLLIETDNLQIEKAFLKQLIEDICNVEMNGFWEWYDKRYRKDVCLYIKLSSVFYGLTDDEKILYRIIDILKSEDIDCFIVENIRRQIVSIFFVKQELKMKYSEERYINQFLIRQYEKKFADKFVYIPKEERNKNAILMMTDQLIPSRHAPSILIMNTIVKLVQMGFKVYLLVNVTVCAKNDLEMFWWNGRCFTVFEEYYNKNILEYEGIYIPFMQVNYSKNTEMVLDKVKQYVNDIKPEFIWHIGGTSFIGDVIGECSTMIATKCTDGYAASEADVLASYMVSDGEYNKEAVEYIEKTGQKRCSFLSPLNQIHNLKGMNYSKSEFGLSENNYVISLVGNRLDAEIDNDFRRWMKEILALSDKIMFVTIGKEIQSEDLDGRILQLGYRNDLADVLKMTDLFVNPPRQGGGGGAVSALSAGIPVLTLTECDVANLVPKEFVVRDLKEMQKRIEEYYVDRNRYQKMCETASSAYKEKVNKYENGEVEKEIMHMLNNIREWRDKNLIK